MAASLSAIRIYLNSFPKTASLNCLPTERYTSFAVETAFLKSAFRLKLHNSMG
jgi:hypothetical protein